MWFRRVNGLLEPVSSDDPSGYVSGLGGLTELLDSRWGVPPLDVARMGFVCCLECSMRAEAERCTACPRPKTASDEAPESAPDPDVRGGGRGAWSSISPRSGRIFRFPRLRSGRKAEKAHQ
jgi:hypothetical protein